MRRVALITGASGGIGFELARICAAEKHDLVLVARRENVLRELSDDLANRHGIRSWPIACDLADPAGPSQVAESVKALKVEIDILINNAGFGLLGEFVDQPPDGQLEMIDLNIRALTHLTRLLLPAMIARRSGRILNVASTAAFQPGPLMAVYYAAKAYVLSFSVALSLEVEKAGVTVTALCPGPTSTGFQAVAGISEKAAKKSGMDAGRVALEGYRGMMQGKHGVTPGLANKAGGLAAKFAPRVLFARAAKLRQERRARRRDA